LPIGVIKKSGEISLPLLMLAALLIAPFAEELMFRGFLQGYLTRKYILIGKKKQISFGDSSIHDTNLCCCIST
jgi:hypothetical protein